MIRMIPCGKDDLDGRKTEGMSDPQITRIRKKGTEAEEQGGKSGSAFRG